MGLLIGKRGQTLDSIQYLTSLVINKGKEKYVRIKVDTRITDREERILLSHLPRILHIRLKKQTFSCP